MNADAMGEGDDGLAALADGRADLIVMGDGTTMRTHGAASTTRAIIGWPPRR